MKRRRAACPVARAALLLLAAASASRSSSTSASGLTREEASEVRPPAAKSYPSPTPRGGRAAAMAAAADKLFLAAVPSGQIADDAKCDVEQLEGANDSQLNSILRELVGTSFFRTFAVDLNQRCPLEALDGNKKKEKKKETTTKKKDPSQGRPPQVPGLGLGRQVDGHGHGDDDEPTCAGDLPDLDEGVSACSVEGGGGGGVGDDFFGGGGLGTSSAPQGVTASPATAAAAEAGQGAEDEEDDGFDCPGSRNEALGLDDDAEPLCTVSGSGGLDGLGLGLGLAPGSGPGIGSGSHSMNQSGGIGEESHDKGASVLNSLAGKARWDSKAERDTFQWNAPSDPVVVAPVDPFCDDQTGGGGELPDLFWVDMCSNIHVGDGARVVDLALNPERNTGYNGTHIWKAIYEENCFAIDGGGDQGSMCYEERFLYRLLSGMHTSTTLSIAKTYYPPSKRKGRVDYEPNPGYFMEKIGNNPEYVRNLHFSFVVLLRALRKATPYLRTYEVKNGDIVDEETANILLQRLLESAILQSCHGVFTAFDESLMFREGVSAEGTELVSLKKNFKGVFHNVSSILDCVQCQQCKLHGKMTMLGYGTALKILFMSQGDIIASGLTRNEIVAFINTIAGMSEAIKEVRELTALYWEAQVPEELPYGGNDELITSELVDGAVGAVSDLAKAGLITAEREAELVSLALARDDNLLILARHYSSDLEKFLRLSTDIGSVKAGGGGEPDAIVVGSGLAGLSATLNILDRGGKVIVVEKEHRLGGNSNKASSGINACCLDANSTTGDFLDAFRNDTIRSAGDSARLPLINTLVENSASAVEWLKERVGVDLSLVAQLGGHFFKRTHRPKNGMVGAEIIYAVQKAIKAYEKSGMVEILVDTTVRNLIQDNSGVIVGVEIQSLGGDEYSFSKLMAPTVVLSTGGFASDRSPNSYLAKYRPELISLPATAGDFSTGDGVTLATALGAGTVDMEKVQIHPTGWVDPKNVTNPSKILAGELMRGVGGILINGDGERFCNELGTRAYVADKMLSHDPYYAANNKWDQSSDLVTFSLVLSSSAAADGNKHVNHYTHKGLLSRLEGVSELSKWMGVSERKIRSTLTQYRNDAEAGIDAWGKTSFRGVPEEDFEKEIFYAGTVTPVLHYCMGGITIDTEGHVLYHNGTSIPGLRAAGEVTGGVHGNNRLGGNSLLECTVFGTIVGKTVPVKSRIAATPMNRAGTGKVLTERKIADVTLAELAKHNTKEDCWIGIEGKVYDLTDFAEEHPAGPLSIHELGGKDGTDAFLAVHNPGIMEDFDDVLIGNLVI